MKSQNPELFDGKWHVFDCLESVTVTVWFSPANISCVVLGYRMCWSPVGGAWVEVDGIGPIPGRV